VNQQPRAVATRRNLLMAAAHVFERRGYAATTTREILAEAGATRGALYFHFSSKEQIAVAVTRLQYDVWPEVVASAEDRAPTPLDALLVALEEVVDRFQHDPVVRAGVRLSLERDVVSPDMPLPFVGWERLLGGVLQRAAEAGQLRPGVDPAAEARVLVAAFFGIQHRSLILAQRADLPQRFAEFWVRWMPTLSADRQFDERVAARGAELLG
jgi:AcrR family transcriptional regulator